MDYGRLNQELSATGNTLSPEGAAKTAATLAALKDIEDDEEDVEPRPSTRGDNLHSEKVTVGVIFETILTNHIIASKLAILLNCQFKFMYYL